MLLSRRWRAPAGDGEVLADPPLDSVPRMFAAARSFQVPGRPFGGLTIADFRALARHEAWDLSRQYHASLGEDVSANQSDTWLVAGHQPDLFHPGVWLKNFVLARLARENSSVALNLIVDNDAAKTAAVRVPNWHPAIDPNHVSAVPLPYDQPPGGVPFEEWRIRDDALFRSFPDRLRALTNDWPFEPIVFRYWEKAIARAGRSRNASIAQCFATARRALEREWGALNLELPVSWLCQSRAFGLFVESIRADLPRFRHVYNSVVQEYRKRNGLHSRNHPVPDLGFGEAPFWVWGTGDTRRRPMTNGGDKVRPRALTLTLFARLALADVFLHGIGGGKYDELTDAIAAEYFGTAPPPFLAVSGTLRLPLPGFSTEPPSPLPRDLRWNPQRHFPDHPLADERVQLIRDQPATRRGRRQRYIDLRANLDRWQAVTADALRSADAAVRRAAATRRANVVLRSRELSFILFPEAHLRGWLTLAGG